MGDAIGALRATRWDRLCAALEEVDPDRVIDASRIIERQKTLMLSDTALFQIIQLRYQDAKSPAVSALVHLYVLKDSWLLWLKRTEECLRKYRLSQQGSKSRRDPSSASVAPRCHAQLDLHAFWDLDEGSLDIFRDGQVLATLVEECLSYTDAFVNVPPSRKPSSQQISQLQYAAMFPSLPAASSPSPRPSWRLSGDSASEGSGPYTSTTSNPPQSPTTGCRGTRSRRATSSRRQVAAEMKEQEDTVRRAISNLSKLNELCTTFLSWKERGSSTEPFLPMESLEHAASPTTKDDLALLMRLHWLSLALHERVHNERLVPPAPTVSFLIHTQFQPPKNTLQTDEDSDLAVLVATQFTYFPQSHQLEILSPFPRKVSIRHPKALAIQYDCVLVDKEAYVFDRQHHVFRPFWELMKHLLFLFDEKKWFFEMNAIQREVERALLGATAVRSSSDDFSTRRPSGYSASVMPSTRKTSGSRDERARANFELTVRTSTIRRARTPSNPIAATAQVAAGPKVAPTRTAVPVSTVQRRRQHTGEPLLTSATTEATSAGVALRIEDSFVDQDAPVSQPVTPRSHTPDTADAADGELFEPDLVAEGSIHVRGPSESHATLHGSVAEPPNDSVGESSVPSCILSEVREVFMERPSMAEQQKQLNQQKQQQKEHHQEQQDGEDQEEQEDAAQAGHQRTRRPPDNLQDSFKNGYFSEVGHRHQLNFSAEVLQGCDQKGLAVIEHRFRVSGKPIGKGAFGAVYRALDLETGVTVAVKQSRYTLSGAVEDNVNWNELQLLSMLPAHPNVITFHGASKELETKQLLLVMEYASGGSIMATYNDFWPIPEQLSFQHAREMALGLKHLHDHGVIHGDVKPENVLTRSNGSVALTDFGCSSVCHSGDAPGAVTAIVSPGAGMSNSLSGTPPYMAPEVIFGAVSTKSDVWAFACTLLQLWLWELPWSDGHDVDVFNVVPLLFYIGSQDVLPYSDAQIETAPRWLQKIAARALVRSVEDRCNMAEILSILTSYSAT